MALTAEQEQDLEPVVYEWNMLVAAAERVKAAKHSGDKILTNLLLEAFVVHFRQLGNFLFASPEEGDLHVGQFVGGRSWRTVTGRKNRWDDLLVRASRQVAHLTAERHFRPDDRQKQEWPVSRLLGEVAEELQVFCNRTDFAGFPGIVPSSTEQNINTTIGAGMLPGEMFTSSTNAPTVCNSVVVNRAVGSKP
jgi:hypothetical protein